MGVNQTERAIEVKYDSELHFGSLKDKNNIFFKIKALTGNTQSKHQLKTFMRSYANMVYHGIPFTGKSVKRKSKQSHFAKNGTLRESFKHCFAEINLANFFAELGGNPPPLPFTQSQPLWTRNLTHEN